MKGHPRPAMDRNVDNPSNDGGPPNCSTSFRRLLATFHTAKYGPLSFANTPLPTIPPFPIGKWSASPIPRIAFDFQALFQDQSATPSKLQEYYCPGAFV